MMKQGFTLIEVLLAMSITAILVTSVYFSFSNLLSGRAKIKAVTERERGIYSTIELIRSDLKNAYLTVNKAALFSFGLIFRAFLQAQT